MAANISLQEAIRDHVVRALDLPAGTDVTVSLPPRPEMGDYAVPMFPFAKALRAAPPAIAARVIEAFEPGGGLASMEAAGPFVNVRVDRPAFLAALLGEIHERADAFGGNEDGAGKTVVIDYSSPNISKHLAFHHLRSTMIGNALCRIYRANGWNVVGFNFLGDWGTTHGMLLTAWELWGEGVDLATDGVTKLNQLYVRFRSEAREKPELNAVARDWFRRLEAGDPAARERWETFRKVSLDEFERVYRKLGVRFEATFGESFYEDRMEPVLADLTEQGLLTESEGATVVDLESDGMPPCLLKKQDGTTLYATRDLASAMHRHEEFAFDRALYVVDHGQSLHFRQWFTVARKAAYPFAENLKHVAFGQIRFGGEKTGSRKGNVILLNDVLETARTKIAAVIAEKNPDMPADRRDEVARQVGYGAIIFGDLARERERDYEFEWDKLLSFEGDTGPYCQYQHARIASIVRKSGVDLEGADAALLTTEAEWRVTMLLSEFPGRVRRALSRDEPSVISSYVLDLCREFSSWYAQGSNDPALKVNCADEDVARARLLLARSVEQTVKNGLALLGVEAPEEM